jgi:hypothetical protein
MWDSSLAFLWRSEAMGVFGKLRKVGNYMRKGWHSTNPESYSHYKRGREHERKEEERGREEAEHSAELDRKEEERGREEADHSAELDRKEVQRGREYEERYAAERAAEEPKPESPRDDIGRPD